MRIRITSAAIKVATIMSFAIVNFFATFLVAFAVSPVAGYATAVGMPVVMVWFCTRTFRGESEDVAAPRAWWRMTERPFAGYFLAALFFVAALGELMNRESPRAAALASLVVAVVISAGYLHSSIRLMRAAARTRATAPGL